MESLEASRPRVAAAPSRPRLRPALAEALRLGHVRPAELLSVAAFVAGVGLVFGASASAALGAAWAAHLPRWLATLAHALSLAGAAAIAYGVWVEPRRLTVRSLTLSSAKLTAPVRLVHLSDPHVGSWGALEESVLAAVREARPDAILLTGDYAQFPQPEAGAVERLLAGLAAIAPAYASIGNGELLIPLHETFRAQGFEWLLNDRRDLDLGGARLRVTGVVPGDEAAFWRLGQGQDRAAFSIALYHYPDLVPELGSFPYDLTLCGHTHGGQIRLPWLGALVSMSRAGTRFARGLFLRGGRAAYVTQGVGCESFGLPKMRFLCPPEIVVLSLEPS